MVIMVRIRDHINERQNKKDSNALNIGFVIELKKLIKTLFKAAEVASTTKSKSAEVVGESRSSNNELKR